MTSPKNPLSSNKTKPVRLKPAQFVFLILTILSVTIGYSQPKITGITGKVIDELDQPLSGVSIILLGKQTGTRTNDSGYFRIQVPANKPIALIFSHTGYKTYQQNFMLQTGEQE